MLSNFFVALGGVVPLFCLMAVGVFIKRSRLLTEEELLHVNRMVFQVFFFFMMFYNIYVSDPGTAFQPELMLFGAGGVLLTALVFGIIVCRIEADNARRGPMIQAIFRSNFVLMGIPLISNIFGDAVLAIPTMMVAAIVPLYNVLGVLVLETFRGGRFDLLPILRGVLLNPMIMGAIAAETRGTDRGGYDTRGTYHPRGFLPWWKLPQAPAPACLLPGIASDPCAGDYAYTRDRTRLPGCGTRHARRHICHALCCCRICHGAADAGGCRARRQLCRIQQRIVLLHNFWMGISAQDVGAFLNSHFP